MSHFLLEPEVAGHLVGRQSAGWGAPIDPAKTRYMLDGWLGDELLEATGQYIVTDALKRRLDTLDASGCRFDPATVLRSDLFNELHPAVALPRFWWLVVTGRAAREDFGRSREGILVVSERMLIVLHEASAVACTLRPIPYQETDP